ncbi:MAG: NAD-dependent epimerase/dehydratase family protein [Rhodococcus sp. (in: high G+C Gram-positive bacteria)]
MHVLLTGAAGFIGGHIRTALTAAGHEVTGVDAYSASAHGETPERDPDIDTVDVRSPSELDRVMHGVDVVCHQAAVVGAGVSMADAPAYASHNDVGTAEVLAAMARSGCSRLVLASSMVVYGEGRYRCTEHGVVRPRPRRRSDLENGVFDARCPVGDEPLEWATVDEDAPLEPRSLYAASKLAQENYATAWVAATGGSAVALRYHNVYGDHMPRDTPYSGVAAMFRSSLEAGNSPVVFEDGNQMRDFVDVRDVAAANLAAVDTEVDGFAALNVCSGHPVSIGEVARILCAADGSGKEPRITGDFRSGDVRHVVAGPDRAAEVLGFRARIDPAEGLTRFASAPLRPASGTTAPVV